MTRKSLSRFYCRVQQYFADVLIISQFQREFSDPVPVICLHNVRLDKAHTVTDHVWINPLSMEQGEPFPSALGEGDIIKFTAIVGEYRKGKAGQKLDYTLTSIRSVEIISKGEKPCNLTIQKS